MKKKYAVWFAVLTVAAFLCTLGANAIQTDHGRITVTEGTFDTDLGSMFYKLYVPENATADDPAPAVLLLHGYQNDHETCAAYSIELARRGVVVLAVDEYGHGRTDIGLINRGYVNHKVTVNYGLDSEEDGTFTAIKGAARYRLMMNFSNLSFFDEKYTKDSDGNVLTDSSCGGIDAYGFLASLDFVDSSRMGVSGHSMGTWSSWTVSAAYSGTDIEPKATVLQCGELFMDSVYDSDNIHFNNVMLLQAKYDEFSYFRDYQPTVTDELLRTELRTSFLGTDAASAAWDTTFGNFADGTARRIELLNTNHRLTTHNAKGLAASMEWFADALGFETELDPYDQKAMTKEWLVFLAMLLAIGAMLPLAMLLKDSLFKGLTQELPTKKGIMEKKKWWKNAIITILIAGASYPFMTQLGHGLLPLPENVFRMTIGNGFLSYYGLLILITGGTLIGSMKIGKRKGRPDRYVNIGLGTNEDPNRFSWKLLLQGFGLAACLFVYMYLMVALIGKCFMLDLRFIWPFFKTFTGERFVQFLVYLPVYVLFFLLSTSKAIASLRMGNTYQDGFKGFMRAWFRAALVMAGGVFLVILIEYIPFFAGAGPGADLLFGSTFGGPFMSLLIVFFPQILVFSAVGTYLYRKTGSVFTGSFISAMLACWIVTGGSSML